VQMRLRFWFVLVGLGVAATMPRQVPAARAVTGDADALLRSGAAAFERADYAAAERDWRRAEHAYEVDRNVDGQLSAWLNLAVLQQQVGKYIPDVFMTLNTARKFAERNGRRTKLIGIYNALGVAYTFTRQYTNAESSLNGALSLLKQQGGDPTVDAGIYINLGNLHAARAVSLSEERRPAAYSAALDHFTLGATLAEGLGDKALLAKARGNAARTAACAGLANEADKLTAQALEASAGMPPSVDKVNLLVAIGQTDEILVKRDPVARTERGRLRRRAFDAYQLAEVLAKQLNNSLAASYSIGHQAHLYEADGRLDEALTLTRRAASLAHQTQSPDSLYLWQWQTGRILRAQGETEQAITAYISARDTLETIRGDLALGMVTPPSWGRSEARSDRFIMNWRTCY
jgi:tetratricopeptide (TPR) repeat protein